MPKFYPNQDIIDDDVARDLYDQFWDVNYTLELLGPIKTRKDFISLIKSLELLSNCKDSIGSERSVRIKAQNHIDLLYIKYNKKDYPELWI